MSTMPARRSIRSPGRCTCGTARALGEDIGEIPEGMYPGDYLKPVGSDARRAIWRQICRQRPKPSGSPLFREAAIKAMLDLIRHDLALLDIHHDMFASEAELQRSGAVDDAMAVLRAKGLVYEGVLERPRASTRTTNGSRSS